MTLTDAALAAQARRVVNDVLRCPDVSAAEVTEAALCAVRDAVRAEYEVRLAAAAELFRHIREAAEIAEPVDVAALPGIVENLARECAVRVEEVRQLREALERDHGRYVDLVTALLDIAQGNWPVPDDGQSFKTGEFAKWMQARAREVLTKHRLLIPAATEPSHG